jgi:hypothetical protein
MPAFMIIHGIVRRARTCIYVSLRLTPSALLEGYCTGCTQESRTLQPGVHAPSNDEFMATTSLRALYVSIPTQIPTYVVSSIKVYTVIKYVCTANNVQYPKFQEKGIESYTPHPARHQAINPSIRSLCLFRHFLLQSTSTAW